VSRHTIRGKNPVHEIPVEILAELLDDRDLDRA
jgi:hypothetical protein